MSKLLHDLADLLQRSDLSGSVLFWGVCVAGIGVWLHIARDRTGIGLATGLVGLFLIGMGLPWLAGWTNQAVFWLISTMAIVTSVAAISSRNPVYSAIWFAISFLAVAGLFLAQDAQFLGVVTIAVYAGAIVVIFLFVLMLAQPAGQATYDRISWASFSIPFAVLAAIGIIAGLLTSLEPQQIVSANSGGGTDSANHLARLGAELFSVHLVSVEIAGTLLLVALVGAIAIVIHGRTGRDDRAVETLETGGAD